MLFLALAVAKPVSAASSSHWVVNGRTGRAVPDDPSAVEDLLKQLGLAYRIEVRDTTTMAYVALDRPVLDQFWAVRNDDRRAGLLFGYPETAVDAFVNGTSITPQDQANATAAFKLPVFSTFRLSRDHPDAELALMHEWQMLLTRYGIR